MLVTVRLFATLSRYRPRQPAAMPFEVELAAGATVDDLLRQLGLPAEEARVVFVNGQARSVDSPLVHADRVGIFPPIGGG